MGTASCSSSSTSIGRSPPPSAQARGPPAGNDALLVSIAHPPGGLSSYIGRLILVANFSELRKVEVRLPRITLPRTVVNKAFSDAAVFGRCHHAGRGRWLAHQQRGRKEASFYVGR